MFRIQHREMMDLAAGRFENWIQGDNSAAVKVSKIMYYGAIQSAIFYSLQTALVAIMGSGEEEAIKQKEIRALNGIVDSYLTGYGVAGKVVAGIKNTAMEYVKQQEKGWNTDHTYTMLQALNIAPPIGVKARKFYNATQTMKFNKDVIKERGFHLDNPALDAFGNIVSVGTNVPLDRALYLLDSMGAAITEDLTAWQRMWLVLGWNRHNLGIEDPDLVKLEEEIKKRKKQNKTSKKNKNKKKKRIRPTTW
jgi:hypothetical protein